MKRLIILIVTSMLLCIDVYPQSNWENYGYVKHIYVSNNSEIKHYDTVKFSFEGNYLYREKYNGVGMWGQVYGIFSGYVNGNKYYKCYIIGYNEFAGNFNEIHPEGGYFLVAGDNSTINFITNDNLGQPKYIEVYKKASNAINGNLYE